MRIAWLIQGDEQYGIRSGSRALLTALTNHGIDCPVIALDGGEFTDECQSAGYNLIRLNLGPLPRLTGSFGYKLYKFLKLVRREGLSQRAVSSALRNLNADALHFRRPNLVRIGGQAALDNNIPSFWHMPNAISNEYPFNINRKIYQYRCSRFSVLPIANSKYTASTLASDSLVPQVMYLAVDSKRFDPSKIQPIPRMELGISGDSIVVGVAARLTPNKGQELVVRAALELLARGLNLHVLIIGGPTRSDYYKKLLHIKQSSQWADRIHFLGPVTDVERYYMAMDFSINCRIDAEPCGISVLESMMCKIPVLVHALGGPAETVLDGVTGWHYLEPTVPSVCQGMLRAIGDHANWEKIGNAAREHAIENFSFSAQAEHYLRIVEGRLCETNR